jgi:hypothetical protein
MSAGSVSVSPVVLDGVRYVVTSYSTRYGGRVLVTRDPARGVWCAAHVDGAGRVLARATLSDSAAQEAAWWHSGDLYCAVARQVCATTF